MRRRLILALLSVLAIEALCVSFQWADDGKVTVRIREALAFKKNNDDWTNPPQDFYACFSFDHQSALVQASKVSDRDHAVWNNATQQLVVPGKNQRFFDLYFELWDGDTGNDDDSFDISPQGGPGAPLINGHTFPCFYANIPTGSFPHVTYDVCTGKMNVAGVNGSNPIPLTTNELNGAPSSPGIPATWAALRFDVERDPADWLPDDVAISDVQIVQSVYDASKAVVDKDTSLMVVIASTYPMTLPAMPVFATMTDGFTTVNDTRLVDIAGGTPQQPGLTKIFMFDGTTAAVFKPQKFLGVGTGKVSAQAQVVFNETISPNAPPQLQDCANSNNVMSAADLPLMFSNDLFTVYEPFDYSDVQSFISSPQLQAMYNREETFRLAAWPLATLNSTIDANPTTVPFIHPFCFVQPWCALIEENTMAAAAGIERLVLSVRNGWFKYNSLRHAFLGSNVTGLSMGEFAPHAVLAEDGLFGGAVHELGHSYKLSQHPCSNFNCADEYTHKPQDGAPYAAYGYDVDQRIYPTGISVSPASWPNNSDPTNPVVQLDCPGTTSPVGLGICAPNFMDRTPSSGYSTWIDTFTFNYLLEDKLPHSDPFLVNVGGLILFPSGPGDGSTAPVIEGSVVPFSYQFMGTEDLPDSPLSPMGEIFSGVGPFRIRLVTPAGVHDYRFNPRFFDDPNGPGMIGGFSISVPWDFSTTSIELIGPTDWRTACWSALCPGGDVVLDQHPVTPMPPAVFDLRAGRDAPAPPTPPGAPPATPTIGPGHDAIVSWDAFDADSPELRAALIVSRQGGPAGGGGTPMPVQINIAGNTFTIPHDQMAGAPGTYSGRVLVSDGVNTTEVWNGALFKICNFSNGGVETCNGIDDDCDGTVDNAPTPGLVSVELNPQPFPPAPSGDTLTWTADPLAQSYDIVFADAGALHNAGGGFGSATLGCLAENQTGTSYGPVPVPPARHAYLFLVRGNNCAGPGTYDSGSPSQAGSRDAAINASPAACRP